MLLTILVVILLLVSMLYLGVLYLNISNMIPQPIDNIPEYRVSETDSEILIAPKEVSTEKAAIVFVHGGAFVIGHASGSKNLLAYYAGTAKLNAHLLKYSNSTKNEYTLMRLLNSLASIPEEDVILMGDSCGAYYALQMALYMKSESFRAKSRVPVIEIKKNLLAFVSLSGFIDSAETKLLSHGQINFLRPVNNMIAHWPNQEAEMNPRIYQSDLVDLPMGLYDSGLKSMSFGSQALALFNYRQTVENAETELYLYPNMNHCFMYNWSRPEAKDCAQRVLDFIDKHLGSGSGEEEHQEEPATRQLKSSAHILYTPIETAAGPSTQPEIPAKKRQQTRKINNSIPTPPPPPPPHPAAHDSSQLTNQQQI